MWRKINATAFPTLSIPSVLSCCHANRNAIISYQRGSVRGVKIRGHRDRQGKVPVRSSQSVNPDSNGNIPQGDDHRLSFTSRSRSSLDDITSNVERDLHDYKRITAKVEVRREGYNQPPMDVETLADVRKRYHGRLSASHRLHVRAVIDVLGRPRSPSHTTRGRAREDAIANARRLAAAPEIAFHDPAYRRRVADALVRFRHRIHMQQNADPQLSRADAIAEVLSRLSDDELREILGLSEEGIGNISKIIGPSFVDPEALWEGSAEVLPLPGEYFGISRASESSDEYSSSAAASSSHHGLEAIREVVELGLPGMSCTGPGGLGLSPSDDAGTALEKFRQRDFASLTEEEIATLRRYEMGENASLDGENRKDSNQKTVAPYGTVHPVLRLAAEKDLAIRENLLIMDRIRNKCINDPLFAEALAHAAEVDHTEAMKVAAVARAAPVIQASDGASSAVNKMPFFAEAFSRPPPNAKNDLPAVQDMNSGARFKKMKRQQLPKHFSSTEEESPLGKPS